MGGEGTEPALGPSHVPLHVPSLPPSHTHRRPSSARHSFVGMSGEDRVKLLTRIYGKGTRPPRPASTRARL